MQNFTEANTQCQRALELDTKLYGSSHPLVGQIQEEWGHYAEAEKLLRQTSASTSFVRGACLDLVLDYQALNDPQEATEYKDTAAQ
jgi:hypothetical protein